MKIRTGFVSNSSTSSFVIIGYKVEGKLWDLCNKFYGTEFTEDDDVYDKIEEHDKDDIRLIHMGEENLTVCGRQLADMDDLDGIELFDIDLVQLNAQLQKASQKLDINGQIKVISGIRMC